MKFFLILMSLVLQKCDGHERNFKYITVYAQKDSCYTLALNNMPVKAYRNIEIVENTLSDTTGFGYAIVLPGKTGRRWYLRVDSSYNSGLLDNEYGTSEYLPKTETFCINLYKHRPVEGYLKIKYYY